MAEKNDPGCNCEHSKRSDITPAVKQGPGCNCEYSRQFKVTPWGDIVPADISEEDLAKLRKARNIT